MGELGNAGDGQTARIRQRNLLMLPFWPTPISNNLPVADPLLMRPEGLDSDMDLASATGEIMSAPGFRHSRPFLANSLFGPVVPRHLSKILLLPVIPLDCCNLPTFHLNLCPAYLVLLSLLFFPRSTCQSCRILFVAPMGSTPPAEVTKHHPFLIPREVAEPIKATRMSCRKVCEAMSSL